MITLDQFILTTIPLEQYFNDTPLGQGTGFMWKIQEQFYLVTNWHVLSMRDFFARANLRKDAGRPNILRAFFNIQTGSFEKQRCRPAPSAGPAGPSYGVARNRRAFVKRAADSPAPARGACSKS
jgi:hypothetical protein